MNLYKFISMHRNDPNKIVEYVVASHIDNAIQAFRSSYSDEFELPEIFNIEHMGAITIGE